MTDPRLDYVVEIADAAGYPLGELRQWDNLSYSSIVCEVGGGQVDCRASAWNRDLVGDGAGRQVLVWRAGKVRSAGELRIAGEAVDLQADMIQLTWDDKLALLANEPAFPNPSTPTGQGPQTHDSRAGWTSSVVQGFVDANVGPAARPERRAVALSVGPDPQAGTYLDAPVVARWDNLLELVQGVAIANGIVFEVVTDDRGHTFQTRQARDLTARVQFSRGMNNLGAGEFNRKAPEATRVLVLGPYEGTERLAFMVPDASETTEAEARWRRKVHILDSSSLLTDDAAKAAAEVEAENLKTWVSSWKDGLGNVVDAYKKTDRVLRDLDLTLGDTYIGPVTDEAIAAERTLAITVADEIGFQLAVFGDSSFDIDLEKDLNEQQLAALVELKRVRDGYLQGDGTPGGSIINGVAGAVDALYRVQQEYPTGFNVKQQVALDGAMEAFGFLGAKIDLFLDTQPIVAQYKRKALDFAAAADVANRDLTIHSLYAEAFRVLDEKGETVEAQFEILDGTFDFGVDYLLGDFVSIQPDGLGSPVEKPVREFTETASSSGRKVTVVVGDYNATSGTGEALKTREVLSAIRRLQTR